MPAGWLNTKHIYGEKSLETVKPDIRMKLQSCIWNG
jgi:hypothetical protein